MPPPESSTEPLTVAEKILDPQRLAAELVRAMVQIAAVHAGIPLLAARAMGQVAKDVFGSLLSSGRDAPKEQAVQYLDLTLSAKNGSSIKSPALHEIAVSETTDVISKLLSPEAPKSRTPASPPRPATSQPAHPAPPKPTDPAPPPRARPGHEPGSRPQSPPAPSP